MVFIDTEYDTWNSCPMEILGVLDLFNAEGRPIWKPMHAADGLVQLAESA